MRISIDCDFPGGNIVVERAEGDDVYLHQDLRDTEGDWFYWCFRVRAAAGRKLAFHFTSKRLPISPMGPAVSSNGDKVWSWLGKKAVVKDGFVYSFAEDADEVRFCIAIPYVESNLHAFLEHHAGNPYLKVETHCTTRKERITERLRLGKLDGEPRYRVLLTSRNHACEMMATWVMEGILEAVLSETDDGEWFRKNVELLAIPFIDKDGVEDGDQGKNRKPYDHNRDYLGKSIYPSVAAIREFVPGWSNGRLKLAIDMHCPTLHERKFYIVGNPSPVMWERQQKFGRILQQVQTGPLVYNTKNNLPYGVSWNKLKPVTKNCSGWMSQLPGISLSASMEFPYSAVGKEPLTEENSRTLGFDLARAIRRYLVEEVLIDK